MGTYIEYVDFTLEGISKIGLEIKNLDMCELGNQHLKPRDPSLWKGCKTGKQYFSLLGANHTSIDINNKNGALKINLCNPIGEQDESLVEKFQVLTNFGTSEHVKNQYMCWKNINDLCLISGIMTHVIPNTNRKKRHGYCAYSIDFFLKLAEAANYEIIEQPSNRWEEIYVSTILKKNNKEFIDKKEFDEIFKQTCKMW